MLRVDLPKAKYVRGMREITFKNSHMKLSRVKSGQTNVYMNCHACVTRYKCPVIGPQILSRPRVTFQKQEHCHSRRQQGSRRTVKDCRRIERGMGYICRFPSLFLPYNLPSLGARTDKFGPVVKNLFYWSARYMICAANSVECVFLSPNLYDVIAP